MKKARHGQKNGWPNGTFVAWKRKIMQLYTNNPFRGLHVDFHVAKTPFFKVVTEESLQTVERFRRCDTSYTLHESSYGWTFFLLMLFLAKENKIWVMSGSSKEFLLEVYDFDSSSEAPQESLTPTKLSGQEG